MKPIKNQEADTVIEHFQSVCNQFGYSTEVVGDRGSQYTSRDFQELCLKFNIVHKPGTPHSQWKNGRCENAIGRLKRLLEKSEEEETSMEDVLLNIWDTPSDSNTPSPFELMFHRKVKSDLPSIPLSLFDSTNSINAGHRSVKHADRANERENRGELLRLEQNPTIMFMKKRQEKKARWSYGCFSGRTAIIHHRRRCNRNTTFQRPGPHQANFQICPYSTYGKSFYEKEGRRCTNASGNTKHQGYG